jgi:predicted small metal-binding protein
MNPDLKFQLRLTLTDEFAPIARNKPGHPSILSLTDILRRHDAVMKCQFDAFADYMNEAEDKGIDHFPLYHCTKKTIEDSAKKAKYTKSFTLYVAGDEVYGKDQADALEAELKPLVGGPIVAQMFRYDTDPAHNPQPPRQT